MTPLEDAISEQLRVNHDAVDTMIERALVLPGDYGVLVTMLPAGNVLVELPARCRSARSATPVGD